MNLKQELLFRAICAYEHDGVANFSLKNLEFYGRDCTIRTNIKELVDEGLVENITINGLYSRYKIFNSLDCPKFIFNINFSLSYKTVLLAIYKLNEIPENLTPSYLSKHSTLSYNTIKKNWSENILEDYNNNKESIKLNLSGQIEESKNGVVYVGARKEEYKCQFCGETDPNMFYKNNHSTCKNCVKERKKSLLSNNIVGKLYQCSRRSWKSKPKDIDYNITKEYIQEILTKQNYKCYYTGVDLKIGNKFTNPTIDRIDSNLGYIKGNIVICTEVANIIKNDLSVNELKNQIELFHNNINNF